ncbi:hypothetical protein HDU93_004192, partial [Gonapodya sp. JEL0774]
EQDALAVISAVSRESEEKDARIKALYTQVEKEKEASKAALDSLVEDYERRIVELNNTIGEKDSAYKVLQHEHAVVKDFRRKRHELFNELDTVKRDLAEMERRHKETVARLERKHFEDTVRLQTDSERKISELSAKAEKEAVASLEETTKEIYRENVRVTDALHQHVYESQSLKKRAEKLEGENQRLLGEKELHEVIVREKILQSKSLQNEISTLKGKVTSLEHSLSYVVAEYEKERVSLADHARNDLDEVRSTAAELKTQLERKTREMKHIRRLAQHLCDQRTDVEIFFMDALEHIREEIRLQTEQSRRTAVQQREQRLRELYGARNVDAEYVGKLLEGPPEPEEKTEFTELPWQDKERVLRLLFAKMNGQVI